MNLTRESDFEDHYDSISVYSSDSSQQTESNDRHMKRVICPFEWKTTSTPCTDQTTRSRPGCFKSLWTEVIFITSICLSQVFDEYLTSGFFALMPALTERLQPPGTSATWPAAITPLVISAFLLPFGRLADMYGGFSVFVGGLAWAFTWTVLAGYTTDAILFIVCRAMQGLGAAAYLPAGLAMLGRIYHAGTRKNMVFSVYGAMAPFGSFVGIFAANLVSRYDLWSEFFYIGAAVALLAVAGVVLTRPATGILRGDQATRMDWAGSVGVATSLILLVYSIIEAAEAKQTRRTAHVATAGALALTSSTVTALLEFRFVCQPLIPASVVHIKYMCPLMAGLLLSYGAINVYACYATLHIREVIGIGPMQTLAWFTPMAGGGCLLAIVGGRLMHLVSGTITLVSSSVAVIVASLLFIHAPQHPSYWTWIFPAMICATIAIDLVFSVVNVFLSSSLPANQQGIAGSLAHALIQFSGALFLALADTVTSGTTDYKGLDAYHNAFWLQCVGGALALIVFVAFVRIEKAREDEPQMERGFVESLKTLERGTRPANYAS